MRTAAFAGCTGAQADQYCHNDARIRYANVQRERNLSRDLPMPIRNAIASVAVKDLKAAVVWYERLIGRRADSTPMPELAEWKFDGGGSLQVYQLAERAGKGSATLAVGELNQYIAELKKHGIDPGRADSESQSQRHHDKRPGRQQHRNRGGARCRSGALIAWQPPKI